MNRSVTERTTGKQRMLPMTGMLRITPLQTAGHKEEFVNSDGWHAGGAQGAGIQCRREKVAEQIEEAPSLDNDSDHRPTVEHQHDAAEEARSALGLALLEKESVRF